MPDKQVRRSEEARRAFRTLLDDIEHHGAHVTVLRYTTPAAVMVPVSWYQQATACLEREGANAQ